MKVALLISGESYSHSVIRAGQQGVPVRLIQLERALVSLGHSVRIFCANENDSSYSETLQRNKRKLSRRNNWRVWFPRAVWNFIRDGRRLLWDLFRTRSIKGRMEEWGPNLVIEFRVFGFSRATRDVKNMGLPVVLDVHEPFEPDFVISPLLFPLFGWLERRRLSSIDRFICVSKTLRDYYVEDLRICPPAATWVNHMSVDPQEFFEQPERSASIRDVFNLEGKTVIGYVGWFTSYSQVDLIIRALAEIGDDSLVAMLVGEGLTQNTDSVRKLAQGMGVSGSVILVGQVPRAELPGYLGAMDIAVMPNSNWYGSPTKLFEYGALSRPIIAPATGPVREIMEHGREGLLVAPGDVHELARGIKELASNLKLRSEYGKSFHQRVTSEYSITSLSKTLSGIIESLDLVQRNGKDQER